jgi:hypothetical protein
MPKRDLEEESESSVPPKKTKKIVVDDEPEDSESSDAQQSESEESEDSEADSESEEETDGIKNPNAKPATIWLSEKEYWGPLPLILNSSATRKKTIDNYIAPLSLRNSTQRGSDYRGGVWITNSGKLDPEDERSGIYKCETNQESEVVDQSSGDESDASEDADQTESDSENSEDDWDAEVATKKVDDAVTVLTEDEKKAITIKNLKESFVDEHFMFQQKSKQKQARARELLDATQVIVEAWDGMKKKYRKELSMKFDSALHCEVPKFEMLFTKRSRAHPIKCNFDCKEFILRCQCLDTFSCMSDYVDHVQASH